jgi:hypothetical protein
VTHSIIAINWGDRVRTYRNRFEHATCWELIVSGERGHGARAW